MTSDPKKSELTLKWYIVHTYSGFEHKVKTTLEERIKTLGQEAFFGKVIVPTEQVMELRKGKKKTSSRKFYPGYIMVQMAITEETWHTVRNTAKVTGFVGGGNMPSPIPDEEAERILQQMEEGISKPKPKYFFEEGDEEFPPNVRLLYDKNSIYYLPHEMLGNISWLLVSRIYSAL